MKTESKTIERSALRGTNRWFWYPLTTIIPRVIVAVILCSQAMDEYSQLNWFLYSTSGSAIIGLSLLLCLALLYVFPTMGLVFTCVILSSSPIARVLSFLIGFPVALFFEKKRISLLKQKTGENPNFFHLILSVPKLGGWLTTLVALGPPALVVELLVGFEAASGMLLLAVVSFFWMLCLKKTSGVQPVLPLINIPIIYITPIWLVIGLIQLVSR